MRELLLQRQQEQDCGLTWQGQSHSWGDLIERARRLAHAFLPHQGQSVALVSENSLELVEALLACWWAGCTPTCLPPPARLQKLPDYSLWLHSAGAQAGWCTGSLRERLGEPWQSLPLSDSGQPPLDPQPEAHWAYLQFSSGTTLDPKPVRLSHANLTSNLEAIASQLPGGRRGHSCCSWLPLYHDMGLIGCLLSALYAPGDLVLLTPQQFALRPGRWLDEISQRRITITAAPNFALQLLLERDSGERDLSSLQRLLLGGETILAETLEAFYERYRSQGLRWEALTPVYGLAEATLAVTFSAGPRIREFELSGRRRRLVSLGRPLPGVGLQLRGETPSANTGEASVGEILVWGDSLGEQLESPYPTGDVGLLEEGELYFVGRSKDILLHHGRNHAPEVVEQLLLPLVSCAVALEEEKFVCLIETPRRGQPPPAEWVQAQLGQAPLPIQAQWVESGWLPRTSSGKISRYQSRLKWQSEASGGI